MGLILLILMIAFFAFMGLVGYAIQGLVIALVVGLIILVFALMPNVSKFLYDHIFLIVFIIIAGCGIIYLILNMT